MDNKSDNTDNFAVGNRKQSKEVPLYLPQATSIHIQESHFNSIRIIVNTVHNLSSELDRNI